VIQAGAGADCAVAHLAVLDVAGGAVAGRAALHDCDDPGALPALAAVGGATLYVVRGGAGRVLAVDLADPAAPAELPPIAVPAARAATTSPDGARLVVAGATGGRDHRHRHAHRRCDVGARGARGRRVRRRSLALSGYCATSSLPMATPPHPPPRCRCVCAARRRQHEARRGPVEDDARPGCGGQVEPQGEEDRARRQVGIRRDRARTGGLLAQRRDQRALQRPGRRDHRLRRRRRARLERVAGRERRRAELDLARVERQVEPGRVAHDRVRPDDEVERDRRARRARAADEAQLAARRGSV